MATITTANSELAARAWLRTVPGIPVNGIGGELPQDTSTWAAEGFVQIIVTGAGKSNMYYGYRCPVITAHLWAVNPGKQTPPWWKANQLGENIYKELLKEDNGKLHLDLGVPGFTKKVRVYQAWEISEPKKIPWGFPSGQGSFIDPGNTAHYVMDFQLAWAELP